LFGKTIWEQVQGFFFFWEKFWKVKISQLI